MEANGGSVEHRGVLRVNGELAVTRTLGNRRLSRDGILSSEPDVVFVSHRDDDSEGGGGGSGSGGGCGSNASFLVLASDGLWDVVSSQEAVDMVKEVILGASSSPSSSFSSSSSSSCPTDTSDGGGETEAVVAAGSAPSAGSERAGEQEQEQEQPSRGRRRGRVPRGYGSYFPGQTFQVAATSLTHEAYVRGSTDNIGVCVVDLRHH